MCVGSYVQVELVLFFDATVDCEYVLDPDDE